MNNENPNGTSGSAYAGVVSESRDYDKINTYKRNSPNGMRGKCITSKCTVMGAATYSVMCAELEIWAKPQYTQQTKPKGTQAEFMTNT